MDCKGKGKKSMEAENKRAGQLNHVENITKGIQFTGGSGKALLYKGVGHVG